MPIPEVNLQSAQAYLTSLIKRRDAGERTGSGPSWPQQIIWAEQEVAAFEADELRATLTVDRMVVLGIRDYCLNRLREDVDDPRLYWKVSLIKFWRGQIEGHEQEIARLDALLE